MVVCEALEEVARGEEDLEVAHVVVRVVVDGGHAEEEVARGEEDLEGVHVEVEGGVDQASLP